MSEEEEEAEKLFDWDEEATAAHVLLLFSGWTHVCGTVCLFSTARILSCVTM